MQNKLKKNYIRRTIGRYNYRKLIRMLNSKDDLVQEIDIVEEEQTGKEVDLIREVDVVQIALKVDDKNVIPHMKERNRRKGLVHIPDQKTIQIIAIVIIPKTNRMNREKKWKNLNKKKSQL